MELIMSTSVIASARQSTSSVFNVVTRSADTVIGLLDATALTVDILTHKARVMNHAAITSSKLDMSVQGTELTLAAATRHADLLEETHKRNFPAVQFDRAAAFTAALKTMEDALKS
jgi:hypothetical protein